MQPWHQRHGGESSHRFESPKSYYWQQYFETVDLVHGKLTHDFQENRGTPVAALLKRLLLDATNGIVSDNSHTLENLKLYAQDIDIPHLMMQLQILPDLLKTYNEKILQSEFVRSPNFGPYMTS